MSHQPERQEKDCLNCGTSVAGRFCQFCGQENIVPKQNFWGLAKHFVYDIFHFDGKFFETLKKLLFRPGLVPQQYVRGRRVRYLDPIRMYLFTSAIFFLIFISFSNIGRIEGDGSRTMTWQERMEAASVLYDSLKIKPDSLQKLKLEYLLDTNYLIKLTPSGDTLTGDSVYPIRLHNEDFLMQPRKFLPGDSLSFKGPLLKPTLEEKYRQYKYEYGGDDDAFLMDLLKYFMKMLPYILFISLPFFALILKLIYIRRKEFYYSDHAVFTLYHYIFTFILLLICFLLQKLNDWLNILIIPIIVTLIFFSGGVHLFFAMKRFYAQGTGKTLLKFLLLNVLAFIVINLLMLVFIILSIFQF